MVDSFKVACVGWSSRQDGPLPHIPALKGGSALHPRSEAQIVQVFRAEMVLFGGLFG